MDYVQNNTVTHSTIFCCVMTVCVITMLSLDGTDENGDVEEKRGGKKIERLNDAQKEEA